MELDPALWSRLPFEIVERTLSFLAVPDLCRYRTVCKKWNQVICDPKFGVAHAQNSSKRVEKFIVICYTVELEGWTARLSWDDPGTCLEWCFLDVARRRWYNSKDVCQRTPQNYTHAVATDGDLVCQHVEDFEVLIVVYNPITKELIKGLPDPPLSGASKRFLPNLSLVVDGISLQFKIFLIHQEINPDLLDDPSTTAEERLEILTTPLMYVYDSVTNEWKGTATNPSCFPSRGVSQVSSIMFEGLLYVCLCFWSSDGELWRYSILKDEWENVGIPIFSNLDCPKLLISANRLFLFGWFIDTAPMRLEVSELRIHEMNHEKPFGMTYDYAMEVFGIKSKRDSHTPTDVLS